MPQIDAAIKRRSNIKGSLTKVFNYARNCKDIEASQLDLEQLKVRLRRVEGLLSEFHEIENTINELNPEDESHQDDFEDKYYTTVADLNKLVRRANLIAGNMSFDLNDTAGEQLKGTNIEVKLPKISIAPFYGSYTEWQSFYDLFSSTIHENLNLNPAQKFQYLKGFLRDEAANLLKHLPISDANYIEALNKLKNRYDRKRYTVQSFIKSFLDLPSINSTPQNIRKLMDTADEVIRGLKAIGPEAESRDPWLVYLLVQKLDEETRDKWATETTNIEFPTCQSLIDFLMKRADALDSVKGYPRKPVTQMKSIPKTFTSAVLLCSICKKDSHPLFMCPKFKEWTVEKRRELVKTENRCFNCFGESHTVYLCKSKGRCHYCRRRHNSLLHLANDATGSTSNQSLPANSSMVTSTPSKVETQPQTSACFYSSDLINPAVLPTATVRVQDISGQSQLCRVLLDSGSQNTFITEALVQKLGLKRTHGKINIQGIANQKLLTTRGIVRVVVSPHFKSNFTSQMSAYIVPSITTINPVKPSELLEYPCVSSLTLADINPKSLSKIDLLIGADKFFDILKPEQIKDSNNRIYAHNTHLGWILTGNISHAQESTQCNTITVDNQMLDKTLRSFWESEEVFRSTPLLPEHQFCEELFKTTTAKLEDKHYMVKLPFKPGQNPLKESLNIAIKRLHSMERKFLNNPSLQEQYAEFMEEYRRLGHMVEVDPPKHSLEYLYLPHHGVWKEGSTTTKMRVVFDASAKTSSGYSLNDNLLTGPILNNLLSDILLRFRVHRIVFTADAEKMYRQIWIHPTDRRFQRIVWRETPTIPVRHFELKTLTYGMSSAPYLATRVIHQIAEENHNQYPEASQVLQRDTYIDDLLTGAHSIPEAIKLAEQLSYIMGQSGFNLRKWSSNSLEVLDKMNIAGSSPSHPKIIAEDLNELKVLGLQWQPAADTFTYHITLEETIPTTKRAILSEASRIFDPLGLLSPYIVKIKSFFQTMWLLDVKWDDKLPAKIQTQWQSIRGEASELTTLTIPRWLCMTNGEGDQLHGFCDSSEIAFAATVYLRTRYSGSYVTNLIAAKSKVAPIKNISLPRLELNGALLLTRLIKHIQEVLCIPDCQIFGWTDSTIVLDWLSEPPRRWKTYVANRTSEILEVLPRGKWQHISSNLNPADCATRGLSPKELKSYTLWWHGPEFLRLEADHWPKFQKRETINHPERREKVQAMTTICLEKPKPLIEELCSMYSSYDKVIRILIIIRKFYYLCHKEKTEPTDSTRYDWQAAETEILRDSQLHAFREEINDVNKGNAVFSKSTTKSLNPFLDKRGILRVGGRIEKSIAPYDTRHPIILSANSNVTKLIIEKYHKMYLHCGASLLLSLIRRKYWIVKGRNLIKSVIRRCVYCIKQRPQTESQLMGSLPKERVELIRPFLKIGLDFAGPIKTYLKRGRGQRTEKSYICLIICLSTKAVHLELVGNLSTDAFLGALYRFFGRRGVSTDVFSDNGTNFQGASRKLNEINKFLKNNMECISNSVFQRYQVAWHFIPPYAPHFGGIWEAGIKSAKTQMTKVIGDKTLTQEELHTLLVQIEGLLNSRPLCVLSEDEMDPLTPAHFLIGHPITIIPQPDLTQVSYNRLSHYNAIIRMSQLFWKRWHQEYLTSMQARTKWHKTEEDIQINDVVLVKDENLLMNQWKMGRIVQVFPGSDGRIRVAEIKTTQGTIRRSITKLCRLPIN